MVEDLPSIGCMVLYKDELPHLERIVPKIVEAFDHPVFVTNLEPSTDGSDEFLRRNGIEPLRMKWVEDYAPELLEPVDLSYDPVPPKQTFTVKTRYVFEGQGKPLPLEADNE